MKLIPFFVSCCGDYNIFPFQMKCYISCGERDAKTFTQNIFKRTLSDQLAVKFSYIGKKGMVEEKLFLFAKQQYVSLFTVSQIILTELRFSEIIPILRNCIVNSPVVNSHEAMFVTKLNINEESFFIYLCLNIHAAIL